MERYHTSSCACQWCYGLANSCLETGKDYGLPNPRAPAIRPCTVRKHDLHLS